ncbi:hypothetical protein [Micromonospora sp. NPDC047730]|uniref:hypothetical protein n=1 Tax=Micromonospora sp. NPDC047730 TaxID=3364253 RepID=UPI0037237A33
MSTTETALTADEVKAAVAEWRKAHPDGVPVLHWLGGDREDEPEIDFAYRPEAGSEPTVMLYGAFRPVPMAHVEPHPLASEVAALSKPEERELEFPYPPCPFCRVDTYHNGDNFQCGYCSAIFDSHSNLSTRRCVEDCGEDATVVGSDKQPRCVTCEVRVRAGELRANEPYPCTRCKSEVVGIPVRMEPHKRKLCPGCLERELHQEQVAEILARRSS